MKTITLKKNNLGTKKNIMPEIPEKHCINMPLVGISPVDVLSKRELEVFRLIGAGKSTSGMAKQFHLSVKTVETYRSRIKVKLCLKHNKELIQGAMRWFLNEYPQDTVPR